MRIGLGGPMDLVDGRTVEVSLRLDTLCALLISPGSPALMGVRDFEVDEVDAFLARLEGGWAR
jgi:hypothetical protein